MIVAERAARIAAQAELTDARAEAANAQADLTSSEALIAHLKLAIEKLRRELYGTRSERKARLLDQMELKLEELEAAARSVGSGSAAAVTGRWNHIPRGLQAGSSSHRGRTPSCLGMTPVDPGQ